MMEMLIMTQTITTLTLRRSRLLTHGGVILDHPKIATVSTRIVTAVEDISVLVALTKTAPEAENAKPAFGHTHATTLGKKQLFRIGTHLMVMMALSILTQKIVTQAITQVITQAITVITQAGTLQRKPWPLESTSALKEMIASSNARRAILQKRGMLA